MSAACSGNRALRGAFRKGIIAALNGQPESDCPVGKRKGDGRLAWSRAFETAWRDGWKYATAEREQAVITLMYWKKI